MLIVNKYSVDTPAPVVATNDGNAVTGITSALWGGINPNNTTGATGNAAAGNGLTNIAGTAVYENQVISKIVEINFVGTLTPGSANFIRTPLSQLGMNGIRTIIGALTLGIYNSTSNEVPPTPTPSLITVTNAVTVTLSIVRDALVFEIADGSQALYQGKTVSMLLFYHQ